MKQSDPLELVKPGSLSRPGLIGRLVRFALGLACCYGLYQLILYRENIVETPVSVLPNMAVLILAALLIINYAVNIGFGRSWGRWPSYVSIAVALQLAIMSWLAFGTPNHPMFGVALWAWLVYFYSHLGVSFLLAAIIATPGCEMRAIPEIIGKITGRSIAEHHCPAALISRIDAWERGRV